MQSSKNTYIDNSEQLTTQPNLISLAYYNLTKLQKHIIMKTIHQVNTNHINKKGDPYNLDIKDLHRETESKAQMSKYIKDVKAAIAKIHDSTLTLIISPTKHEKYSWFTKTVYDKDTSIVPIYLSEKIAEIFSNIKGDYTTYYLKYVFLLESVYSIRIYEIAMSYKHKRQKLPPISVEKFRQQFQLKNKHGNELYPLIAELKRNVLTKAVEEITRLTDIEITYSIMDNNIFFTYKYKSIEDENKYKTGKKPYVPMTQHQIKRKEESNNYARKQNVTTMKNLFNNK